MAARANDGDYDRAQALASRMRFVEARQELAPILADASLSADAKKRAAELMLSLALLGGDFDQAAKAARVWKTTRSQSDGEQADTASFALALEGAASPTAVVTDQTLSARRDLAGLYRTEVKINGLVTTEAVLDTGANFPVITESLAKSANLQLRPTPINVKGSAGKVLQAHLAQASLVMGSSRFENAVMIVMPDEALSFPFGYKITAIVGLPQLSQYGAIRFAKTEVQFRRPGQKAAQPANLKLKDLELYATVAVNDQPLELFIDTGSRTTTLSKKGGEKVGAAEPVKTESSKIYGAGGATAVESWKLEAATISIGGAALKPRRLTVRAAPTKGDADGVLGQDVLSSSAAYELDFDALALRIFP